MKEQYYDQLLNIETVEKQKGFHSSLHYHPYEPTPYEGLETLFQQYTLLEEGNVIDFGCGKGRLNFFIHHFYGKRVIGVEMKEQFYNEAIQNKRNYWRKKKEIRDEVKFVHCLAEQYVVNEEDSTFYFFNPFTIQIFRKVVFNILRSYEQHSRTVDIILYYPHQDYTYFLEEETPFTLFQEITLPNYEQNPHEKFLIYRLSVS